MTSLRFCISLLLVLLVFGCRPDPPPATNVSYVGSAACAGCHAPEYELWTGSDHDRAMAEADAASVLGDFGGAVYEECGVRTTFFREGDDFFIATRGPANLPDTFLVRYTFGFYPLQQYLLPLEGGRLQAFTVAWDSRQKRWFSLYPGECSNPDEWLHWSSEAMNWNYMCADCHSTNLQRNFDVAADAYSTTFSEINVSCEACHGPGERHVELARSGGYDDDSGFDVKLIKSSVSRENLATRSHDTEVETCAPCHSRRRPVYPGHQPGKPFLDHFEPELLRDELYFPDGRIKDEVYEYGSFVQSRMYAEGVRCSDCHDPHSTDLRLSGNALCLQCHDATYDDQAHLRHPGDSPGCVDCHMPERTFMLVDSRRDHSFSIPRAGSESPNACLQCHRGETDEWVASRLSDWYETHPADGHFSEAFSAARRGDSEAEPALIRLATSVQIPDIVRATAVDLLGRFKTVRASKAAADALRDGSPLTRVAAIRVVEDSPDAAPKIEPLLTDSVRLVRVEAARVLSHIGRVRSDAYSAALDEYREGQLALSDQPAAHFNLAVLHEREEKWNEAESAYRTALRLDSLFVPARINLAMLYNTMRLKSPDAEEAGRLLSRAESELRLAVSAQPENADAHYSLGLLLAESSGRLPEAAAHLTRASDIDSSNARAAYNAGLAHQRLGQPDVAERLLLRAYRVASDEPDYLNALSIFYGQQQRWSEAVRFTDALLRQMPDNVDLLQRRRFLEEKLR